MDTLDHCILCGSQQFELEVESEVQMAARSDKFRFMRCKECALVFLNPRVTTSELGKYYSASYLPYRGAEAWGKYAARVSKDQQSLDERRMNHISRFQNLQSESTLLDLGCGKPSFLQMAYERYACHCTGVDFSDEGWKDHRERYQHLDLRIGEADSLSEDLHPDLISMWHYLEHDYHPDRTLAHLRKIAGQSTKMVIEVPNHESDSRKRYKDQWAGYHTPRHTFLFSPETITRLLEQQGWKVLDIDLKGTLDPYNLYWMSDAEQRNIDWSGSMEPEFWRYVRGMLAFRLKQWTSPKTTPWGIMTIMAEPA
ncbi:MAG: class I SAM-dependent methyltransferase [Bacteroidetes bacterium]|nr:class I SAM-dependent methyltransferase [Bacteroidota bacterium]